MLRARYHSNLFYTSQEALEVLEKSKWQTFISMLISFNYLTLYVVIIVPFVLVILQVQKHISEEHEYEECLEAGDEAACEPPEEHENLSALQYNLTMAIVNVSVLGYSLICELIMILAQMKHAKLNFCNLYLLGQVLNGMTLRAMILISA